MTKTVAILGAGKLGVTLAQLAVNAGHTVYLSGSGDAEEIRLSVKLLAPGAQAANTSEAIRDADIVILALPLGKYRSIDARSLDGKLVIDAMNYWWEVDGHELANIKTSSSEMIQNYLEGARVVKALSHMGYHHLHDEAQAKGSPQRKAIAVAGDNDDDVATVAEFIDSLGFDPLPIGSLKYGKKLEPGHPAFGANVNRKALQELTR